MTDPYSNFKSAIVWPDGLDDDGYPVENESWRKPYIRGCEKDAGDWHPISLLDAMVSAIDRIRQVMNIGDNCESPIEVNLGAAILLFFERAGRPLKLCKTINLENMPSGLLLIPQFKWGYYRSDWAIRDLRQPGALLIECDGKEWHSAAAQKAHDAKKDRAALERGYLTLRFTGSQIYRDADTCAQKIYDAVLGDE